MRNRIGVVTYWGIYNFGSFLQAFALQQVLKDMGYKPCIIQVQEKGRMERIKSKTKLLIKLLCHPTYISNFLDLRRMGLRTISDVSAEAKMKFEADQKGVDVIRADYGELRNLARTVDFCAFICGSDQIWNPLGFEFRDYKYLGFAPRTKRIAYAPSFGINYIPSYNRRQVIKGLEGMSSVSVREKEGAQVIEKLIGEKVPVVLDPTLLLHKAEWSVFESKVDLPDEYVVCFFLSRPTDGVLEEVERQRSGKQIVCLPKSYDFSQLGNCTTISVGPREFLHVISKASVVFTDSFHGVAISTIYERPIVVFRRTHKAEYNQFSRIENLLELADNHKCVYGSGNYCGPSYSNNSKIEDARRYSLNYLKDAIIKSSL